MPYADRHGLPCAALRRGTAHRNSRDRPADGRGFLRKAARRHCRGRQGHASAAHRRGQPLLLRAARADHPLLFRLCQALRRMQQPLHLLRHSADPRALSLAAVRRHRKRMPQSHRERRDRADADRSGHLALRKRLPRGQTAAAPAAAHASGHGQAALDARAVLLSRHGDRRAAGRDGVSAQGLPLSRPAAAAHRGPRAQAHEPARLRRSSAS